MVQKFVELVNETTRSLGDLDFIFESNTAFLWNIEHVI